MQHALFLILIMLCKIVVTQYNCAAAEEFLVHLYFGTILSFTFPYTLAYLFKFGMQLLHSMGLI